MHRLYAAIFTRAGRSAVASIRVGGAKIDAFIDSHFSSASGLAAAKMLEGRVYFGTWGQVAAQPDPVNDVSGEELVIARVGDDLFEVHCHGGKMAAARIIDDVKLAGGVALTAEQMLRQHSVDLLAAEAEIAVSQAATDRAAAHLLAQTRGALHRQIANAIALLERHELDDLAALLKKLIAKSTMGIHLLTPFQVVIAGPPNVGKSLLINNLLGFDRSIVFDQPGTTRDVLKTTTAWEGWLFELTDTAGVREQAADPIERAGIDRALSSVAAADVLVFVSDATNKNDQTIQLGSTQAKTIHVTNKCDLIQGESTADPGILLVSAKTGAGLDELVQAILDAVIEELTVGDAVPFMPRHLELLKSAHAALLANRLDECINDLAAIIGRPPP